MDTGITSCLPEVAAERYDTLDHGKGSWTNVQYWARTSTGAREWRYWPAARQVHKTVASDPYSFYSNKIGQTNHYVYVDTYQNCGVLMRIPTHSAVVALMAVLSLTGCAAEPSQPYVKSLTAGSQPMRGCFYDALDDESVPGTDLASAMRRFDPPVRLPNAAVVGTPVKVFVDDMTCADPAKPTLGILYSSGVKLISYGDETSIAQLQQRASQNGAPSERPFDVRSVAGRPSIVSSGGVQTMPATGHSYDTLPLITFNLGGRTYSLHSKDASVPLGKLIAAAKTIK